MIKERELLSLPGLGMQVVLIAAVALSVWLFIGLHHEIAGIVLGGLTVFCSLGLFMVQPNEARVLTLFGSYSGTVRDAGLRWANPFLAKRSVSLRIRNFESEKLKVNDLHGSPIEIAAVIVWQVVDTAEAVFEVDDYESFVHIQSEAALRGLATRYPYDAEDDGGHNKAALRTHSDEVTGQLVADIQERLGKAGVNVIEARISHIAYAPEIAGAMLQRQQAAAILAARSRIVQGAVGMVEMALEQLAQRQVVQLDEERKAAMVSNLLVVLCGDRGASPVINAGTLYGG
jgi:regulator of protease activity HflC (stomatin/prohibitin superfamily)